MKMKIRELTQLMEGWSDEEKALTFSFFSGSHKYSYYPGKPKNHWISLNFEYVKNNLDTEIDFEDKSSEYKNLKLLIYLMAFTKQKTQNQKLLLKTIKENNLENKIINTITYATSVPISNTAKSNYYLNFTQCLKNNFYDLNNENIKKALKIYFKKATSENNKKYYSEALFKIAEYFYDNRDSLDKDFVLEMVEYFLVTGKYVKANVQKIVEISNWREEQISSTTDTIEVYSIIKRLNPIKIGNLINQDKTSVDRMIDRLHTYISKKLYTQEQFLSVDLTEKAADKIIIISFENKTVNIDIASEFITYFSNNEIKEDKYDEIWQKIELKYKLCEKLPEKQKSGLGLKNKI
jgi:hypothetical protein